MQVVIAGGHGKIALRLARLLSGRGDRVRSLIRNPDQADDVRATGAEPAIRDLESATVEQVGEAIDGADAVVFAAGAGAGSGDARKDTMDHGGAVKLIAAANARGVPRFVMVSAIGADAAAPAQGGFGAYLRAKGRADVALQGSGLDYTIVRPATLTDDPATGRVRIGADLGRGSISRDVAAVLVAVLHAPTTIGHTFELTSGLVPVDAAVASA